MPPTVMNITVLTEFILMGFPPRGETSTTHSLLSCLMYLRPHRERPHYHDHTLGPPSPCVFLLKELVFLGSLPTLLALHTWWSLFYSSLLASLLI